MAPYPTRLLARVEGEVSDMTITTKRIYEPADDADGYRVLVDRLWPRGVSKEEAKLDDWDRDVSPSTELRQWWHHNPSTFDEFVARYEAELRGSGAAEALAAQLADKEKVTLLYAAKDPENNATVLASYLAPLVASARGDRPEPA